MPRPERDGAGHRRYSAADIELIDMLVHLRTTGMPLSEIARFIGAHGADADATRVRTELLEAHRRRIEARRTDLDRALDMIRRKLSSTAPLSTDPVRRLRRPDCTIAFSVRGDGPLLFLVGAPAGRSGFASLANELATRFTVVTHDPRGTGESGAVSGMAEPSPEVLADDLHALVRRFTRDRALFAGTSGGAVTVLELARRFPDLIDRAVLHEPPLIPLLDEPALEDRARHAFAMADDDPQSAAQEFLDLSGAGHRTAPGQTPPAHTPLPALPDEEVERNRYFLGRMAGPSVFYAPDLHAARRVPLTICAGAWSHQQMARRASVALANALELPLVDMPGSHLGPSIEPAEFGRALADLLEPREGR